MPVVKSKTSLGLPLALLLVFALTRWPGLFPDSMRNFSAAYALVFCAGVYLPGHLAWWAPVGILIMDVLLNLFYYKVPALHPLLLANALFYTGLVWFGRRYSPQSSWLRLVCGGIIGAIFFYLITNTCSWLQDPGYAKTLAGWFQALTTGLPGFPPTWTFFRNTLLSGGLFTGLFAGAMKLIEALEEAEEDEEAPEDAPKAEPEESKP